MIVNLVSVVLSLSVSQAYLLEMCCGNADSACCPAVDESEDLSAFAAQDLRVRDRATGRALMIIGLVPLILHCPGNTATTFVD